MSFKRLTWKVERKDFFKIYLRVMNGILDLSPTELRIISEFLTIRTDMINRSNGIFDEGDVLSSDNKNLVCKELRITIGNLHNYVKKLKEKRLLIEDSNGKVIINPTVSSLPDLDKISTYDVTFRIEVKDGNSTK